MTEAPDWATAHIKKCADLLNLSHWHISAQVEQCIDGDPDILAQCDQHHAQTTAIIRLRSDLEDTPAWRLNIMHEMVHVAHATIDTMINRVILPQMPAPAREMAEAIYRETYEPFADSMATVLSAALEGRD